VPVSVLFVSDDSGLRYRERWYSLDIRTVAVSYENTMNVINALPSAETVFDAVAICCTHLPHEQWKASMQGLPVDARFVAEQIRSLPHNVCMYDGRKWNAIPMVLMFPGDSFLAGGKVEPSRLLHDVPVVNTEEKNDLGGNAILDEVGKYREKLLLSFDKMGLLVRHEAGRFVIDTAVKANEGIEDQYYFGPSDRRPVGLTTLHKDRTGLRLEVEQFEALINREDVGEGELQRFFEEHPHFLSQLHTPLPHVQLRGRDGQLLIPDFLLKPIVAQQRDSRWEVLELKRPQEKVLAGRHRRRLSAEVTKAIAQLRQYRDHFEYSDAREIAQLLGHSLGRPRLGLLIGKLANIDSEALENEQRHLNDIRIVTYDELLSERRAIVFSS
jgi:hypothetical protein